MRDPQVVELARHGQALSLLLPDGSDPSQRRIAERGDGLDPALVEDLRARVHPGDLCLDVGAHVGARAILLARACGFRVIAIEPQPDLCQALRQNIERNQVGGAVRAVEVALGDASGRGRMTRARPEDAGSARLAVDPGGPIEVATVDSIVGGERLACLWIGAAGAELEVLEGAGQVLVRDSPVVYAELAGAPQRERLEAFLAARGYVPIDLDAGTRVVGFAPRAAEVVRSTAVERRLARLEEAVADLLPALERLGQDGRDRAAILYELWNLGAQSHERAAAGGAGDAAPPTYRPLNVEAAALTGWTSRRKTWTVPKGTHADGFLQGHCDAISVHPGAEVDLRVSTDRVGLFARARVFGPGAAARTRWDEVHASPPLYVPTSGVWKPGERAPEPGSWPVAHRFRIPASWRPGCYIVRFETVDGKATLHHLWVTSRAPAASAVHLSAVMTHVARNGWGGADLHAGGGLLRFGRSARPAAVPLVRPYRGARGSALLRHELALHRWADARGVALDLLTDLEVHARPALLDGYQTVVIAGDASHTSAAVVGALRAFRDRGGRIAVLGAAPAEVEVDVDLDAGTLALRRQSGAERERWRESGVELWRVAERWKHRGDPLELDLLAAVDGEAGPVPRLPWAARAPGLVAGRLTGSSLSSGDPSLLARVFSPDGARRCDTIAFVGEGGGPVFVAGTDRWLVTTDESGSEQPMAPEIAWLTAAALGAPPGAELPTAGDAPSYDVILLSDFRFPGGTSHSNAEEIAAQAARGLSTGLIQVGSPVLKRDRPVNPIIQRLVDDGAASFVPPGVVPRARLLVVRHPTVLMRDPADVPRVEAEDLAVIINQPPLDAKTGKRWYDLVTCQARARERFGLEGHWLPIGPLVRRAIEAEPVTTPIAADDWTNIIDIAAWGEPRAGFVGDRPVVGRHSRDAADKWPADAAEILAAYPDDDAIRVRVMGGAEAPRAVLGHLPARWEVLPFGAMSAREFLAGIDFFVYFHHPGWIEAFGRTILEAMAAGVPAILPAHFEDLFGDAAIYAEPAGVRGVVEALYRDPARYQEWSRRGLALVADRFSHAAHASRLARLGVEPRADAGEGRADGERLAEAHLEADSVYKVDVELGVSPGARGAVRGISRATGRALFELPLDGEAALHAFVVTRGRDHLDVTLALDPPGPVPPAKVKIRRRADRPRARGPGLHDDSVTAAMATYPARRDVVPAVLDTLLPQVDRLFLYLNNYDEVPDFVRSHALRERIVFILDPASQKRAAAKFAWLDTVRGFHLLCDDDILYPPDYATRLRRAIERRDRQAIVGVHGVVYARAITDARSSRRSVFKFHEPLAADTPVHFLGTGTVGLHASALARLDVSRFMTYPIANDEILAVSARAAGVPMICVAREAGWLRAHPDVSFGIFEERSIDGEEHARATELLASGNPWPDLDEEPAAAAPSSAGPG